MPVKRLERTALTHYVHTAQMKQLQQEKAAAEASLKDLASQLNTQRGAAAAEAGDVNDLKQFWQVEIKNGR